MPTNKTRTILTLTPEELESLRQKALKADLSLNNYIRQKLGLPKLQAGATKGNKRNPHGRKGKQPSDI